MVSSNSYVLDTNILLQDATTLQSYQPEATLILPETVVDELDSKKSGFSELAYQAREVGRIIAKGTLISTEITDSHTITKINIGRELWVVSKNTYEAVGSKDVINDRKIIEIARDMSSIFISNDVMARIRASSLGIPTTPLDLVVDPEVETVKVLEVTSIEEVLGKPVSEIDAEYSAKCKAYHLKAKDGNQVLALVIKGCLESIDEKDLARQEATPLNREQKLLSAAILNDEFDIVMSDSKAGSGKNIIALSALMRLIKIKKYNRIYYIRNTVNNFDKAEEVGFLPGNSEKFEPYYAPLYDTIRHFAEQSLKSSKVSAELLEEKIEERIEGLIKKYNITPMTTLGIRGRTLNGLIIIDEIGNFSPNSLKTLLTRIGKGSKVVITGCQDQIDNPYLNKYNNGFAILKAADDNANITTISIELKKVVRGPVTEWAEEVFNN